MSKILKVSESDYRIKVQSGGNITLDTGTNTGVVTITGNLIVQGDYTTINVQDLQIEDNTILLNKGETGAGVTEGTSGLLIDRGQLDNAQFVWDESIDKFSFETTTGLVASLTGIKVGNIATSLNDNLEFDMQSGAGHLAITNSSSYETDLINTAPGEAGYNPAYNDYIPNRNFVTQYVAATGGTANVDRLFSPLTASYGNEDTLVQALTASIKVYVRSSGALYQRAQITAAGLDVDNINIFNDTIKNSALTGNNLILTAATGNIEIAGVLNLDDHVGTPPATGGTTKLYTNSTSVYTPGDSGIYFANNMSSDELIAKNRALLFSVLF